MGCPSCGSPPGQLSRRRKGYQQGLRLEVLNRVDGDDEVLRLSKIRTQEVRHEGLLRLLPLAIEL